MNILQVLFKSSIGKKVTMAATGFILLGFVIGHLVGNLQIFSHPDKINAYAHLLESLGPGLWAIRLFLLAAVAVHVWLAVQLTLENRQARPDGYQKKITLRATLASRTMRWTGLVVFAFIVYHLLHFTIRVTHGPEAYPMTALADGTTVRDVHSMMVLGFQNPLLATFYLISVGLLSWHLSHGLVSMFQSIGLRTRVWSRFLERISVIFCILYFIGNAVIVIAAMTGQVRIQNPLVAGYVCRDECAVCDARNAEAVAESVEIAKDSQS